MEMLLTGEPIDAATARDWGLVNRVVAPAELDSEVERLVSQIVRFSPTVIGIGKEAFYSQVELDEHRAYDLTKAVMASNAAPCRGHGGHRRLSRETPAEMAI